MFINKIYLEICLKYITFVVGKPGRRDSASSVLLTSKHKKSVATYRKPPHFHTNLNFIVMNNK